MINETFNKELLNFRPELDFLISLYSKNKLPQTILFTGEKGIGKLNFSYHLISFILSQDEEDKYDLKFYKINQNNKTFNLLSKNIHPNFHIISPNEKKNINIDQIKKMQNYLNLSSFNKLPKFILFDQCEYLNSSSANSLLKLLEEKFENVFFILIHDTKKSLISTIKSRCIQFKFILKDNEKLHRINEILDYQYDKLNPDFKNKYLNPIFYKDLFDYCKKNNLELDKINLNSLLLNIFSNKNLRKDEFIYNYFLMLIQLFIYKHIKNDVNDQKYFSLLNYFTQRFDDVIKYNLDFESYVLEFKYLVYNE